MKKKQLAAGAEKQEEPAAGADQLSREEPAAEADDFQRRARRRRRT